MIVRATLEHSALTRHGDGRSSYKTQELKVKGMFALTFFPEPNERGRQERIEIVMDQRTLTYLTNDLLQVVKNHAG